MLYTFCQQIAKPAPDPLVKKRRQQTHEKRDGEDEAKKRKTDDSSQEERLKASTIPFWNIPYDRQVITMVTFVHLPMSYSEEHIF
jgi:hypothetical protein